MTRWIAIGVTLLAACAGNAQRQACYAKAETAFAATVAACPGAWEDCPEREVALERLKAEQEACP